jgi:hypothetical protein
MQRILTILAVLLVTVAMLAATAAPAFAKGGKKHTRVNSCSGLVTLVCQSPVTVDLL